MREIPHRYSNRKVNIPQSLYHYLERDILVRGACLRYGGVGKLPIPLILYFQEVGMWPIEL